MRHDDQVARIGWDVVRQFAKDWQHRPYFWDREVDVQVELVSRLRTVMALTGYGDVIGRYPSCKDPLEQEIIYSRVRSCTALKTDVPGRGPRVGRVIPDIVIWADLDDPAEAELDEKGTKPWPIAWACEIKYASNVRSDGDVEKLKALLQSGRVNYACALDIRWTYATNGPSIVWKDLDFNSRFRRCVAFLDEQKWRRPLNSTAAIREG